jgi:hypothetical protein
VDYPVAIYSSSVVLESMAILIAPNRFTYPTSAFISVHQRPSASISVHQRSSASISVHQRPSASISGPVLVLHQRSEKTT